MFTMFWLLPVWIGLGFASLAITILPFKRIAPLLGRLHDTEKPSHVATRAQETRALQIGRTIRFAARHAPWRSNCYPQAIVARLMLGLYHLPFILSMGVSRNPDTGEMIAHAWVECGTVRVTGGDGSAYRAVAIFSDRDRA